MESNPFSAYGYYQRGVYVAGPHILENEGRLMEEEEIDTQQALADFNKAIELNPNFIKAYYHLATLYFSLDIDDTAAQELLEHALSIEPNNVECLLLYADLVSYEGVPQHALEIMDRVIEAEPSAKHLFFKARTLVDSGEAEWSLENFAQGGSLYQAAIEVFQQVVQMEDNDEFLPDSHEYIDYCRHMIKSHVCH
ncbi:hypothetical protein PL18_07755 [Vibrio renipiscarius]|uniref:Uncharacterized protein n=1 Tax=Vibrio renipiscarius TaxID=1461322 RepID=A0A0C2NY95_9VIBR|nr:hypothetical protein PL18_07755 [Vibrio renipiscarius]KII81080.1 hypothetical protein OJ16_05910 [Vibrio renipiscarius]